MSKNTVQVNTMSKNTVQENKINNYGIINYGNNCYLNVVIQLFLSNKQTSNIIAYYLDFEKTLNNDVKLINPKKLLIFLSKKMNVSRQNDSQEAFTELLDLIPELEKHYENKIQNKFKCLECRKSRITVDTFSTFYIHSDSIEESIKQMITDEKFELECECCNKNTETIKSCSIKNLGNVLVFLNVIKQKIKFTDNITYGDNKYKLTGIIKHYGNTRFGHYIYIDYINKLIIDDTTISKFDKLEFDNIYLLFYLKD